jgi:hypothetical protein
MVANEDWDLSGSYYHCSAEWHLWQLKDRKDVRTTLAAVLYPFAYRLSKDSGVFHASAVRIAEHFRTSEWTVLRAMDALTKAGFLVVINKEYFQASIYRVVSHEEWARAHPEQCLVKADYPWSGEEGDELGVQLYTKSGGRVRWFPNILGALRKTGLNDEQIVQEFELFFKGRAAGKRGHYKSVPFSFLRFLTGKYSNTKVSALEVLHA